MSDSPLLDSLHSAAPPLQLYHYTSIEGLRGILTTRELWASAAQYLNDAKEFKLAIDIARGQLMGASRRIGGSRSRLLLYYHEQLERLEHDAVCVFSLSEEGDLLSQWRGYCPPGGGYSVGLPGPTLKQHLRQHRCSLVPCGYDGR